MRNSKIHNSAGRANADLLVADDEVLFDEAIVDCLSPLPSAPGVFERLHKLENERQAAYNQMHRMVADIGALKDGQGHWVREIEMVRSDAMYRLALLAEFRSGGGSAKVLRIGVMSALLAHALGGDDLFCEQMQAAAPLHDVGEISLPDNIFSAPILTEMERELMRSHCRIGHSLLVDSCSAGISLAGDIALGHHERFDGGGYPNRLSGDAIPLASRIVAVVDCFDALTIKRPFRPPYSIATASEMVMAGSGAQFDPAVIAGFRRINESVLIARRALDESKLRQDGMQWLGKPPEPGFWKRFL